MPRFQVCAQLGHLGRRSAKGFFAGVGRGRPDPSAGALPGRCGRRRDAGRPIGAFARHFVNGLRVDVLHAAGNGQVTYRIEAWVKVVGEGSRAWVSLQPPGSKPRPCDEVGWTPAESAPAATRDAWQKIELTFTTPNHYGFTQRPYVKAELGKAGGAVYLDDLSLTRQAAAAPGR